MNIQDDVFVRLTDKGQSVYDKFCFVKLQKVYPKKDRYTFKLKQLMQIFGPHMYDNSIQVFVDDEVIHVKEL